MRDESFMQAALEEAAKGLGHTSPNPAVGAVIVKDGQIIARGFHRAAGQPHAEIEALRALPDPGLARGAEIYVTLEPCSTHGRTPPCTAALISAGLRRVVIGTTDPNPHHAGQGLEILRDAGLEVFHGVLEAECAALNRPFNRWITTRRPWVIAKAALSLDGRLTRPPGEGQWLTSEAARRHAHGLRARVDAILVGANTLRADNPRLTVRDVPGARQPWRVVLSRGENPLPPEAHLFTDEYKEHTLRFIGQSLDQVFTALGEREIQSVLIEGGARVLGEAFDQRLVDEVCFYLAPLICGGPVIAVGGEGAAATVEAPQLVDVQYTKLGDEVIMRGTVLRAGTARV